jgi:hypothetical protein
MARQSVGLAAVGMSRQKLQKGSGKMTRFVGGNRAAQKGNNKKTGAVKRVGLKFKKQAIVKKQNKVGTGKNVNKSAAAKNVKNTKTTTNNNNSG